ncbi:MAG: protein kinase [Parachlamydiaceae bacterium]
MASVSNNNQPVSQITSSENTYVNFSEIGNKTSQVAQDVFSFYDQGYESHLSSESYVNSYKVISDNAPKTEEPSTPQKTSSLFRRLFPGKKQPVDQAKNPIQNANAQLKSIGAAEGKEKVEKLKENAQTIGDVVLNTLKNSGKKAELRKKGSVELELAGLGTVTVLKSSRNPFRKGSLFVRFNGQAHLGSGTFKDVELGIQIKSLNQAIPVAIAKAKVKSDTAVLRKEHEISRNMKDLFGGTIFASKKMVNLRNGEQGFTMPLSHGNYRTPKAMGASAIASRLGLSLSKEKKMHNATAMLETIRNMEAKGYVHADFKEDNIFLDAEGNAQIADWGVFYTRDDLSEKNVTSRQSRIQEEMSKLDPEKNKDKFKALQAELETLRGNFDGWTRTAKYSWAQIVFNSFSAEEWKDVKNAVIQLFGDDPKMTWTDTGPMLVRKKA